jgi:hypothetical protein
MVQDVDPGAGIEGREEQDGTKHSPVKLPGPPNTRRKREDNGGNPSKDAQLAAAHAGQ